MNNFQRTIVLAFFLASGLLAARGDAQTTNTLPEKWHGLWTGTMTYSTQDDSLETVPVRFEVKPIPDRDAWTWNTTYGEGESKVFKEYYLLPVPDQPGQFQIDEQNGIVLSAKLQGDVIYSQFSVGNTHLTARYELRGEQLRVDITSAKASGAPMTEHKVTDFQFQSVQTSLFNRDKQ